MAKLTALQVAAAAMAGGFPAQAIPTAVAVAYGESNFNTTSSNDCCTGLWQVNRNAHSDKIQAEGGVVNLTNPVVNARIANKIYAGDWCGGRAPNGHCQKYEAYGLNNAGKTWAQKLQIGAEAYAKLQAEIAAGKSAKDLIPGSPIIDLPSIPGASGLADTAGAISAAGKALVELMNRIGRWVGDPQSWIRVAEVIGGGVLVGIGLRITFNTQYMDMTKAVVKAVVPGGKAGAVKAAKGAK